MTPTRTRRWSYSAGERGRNRVRSFEHPATGLIYLEFSDRTARRRVALGHRNRNAAKGKAEELAMALRNNDAPPAPELTLQSLFDNYLREVTPEKGESTQQHDRRALSRLYWLLEKGRDTQPARLGLVHRVAPQAR
jgi:hypothetical protein